MVKRFTVKIVVILLVLEAGWFFVVYLINNTNLLDFLKSIKTDAWTAIGTIFLGAVALSTFFYDRYKNRRARVSMAINTTPPDSHQIELTNRETGQVMSKCIYIRIRVEHIMGNSAEDVEIMVSNFWNIDENNRRSVRRAFLPMNLKWSHYGVKRRRITRGLFQYCDFGSFRPNINNTHTRLLLDTAVQPNRVGDGEIPNMIEPGKYEFELILSGRNSNIIRKRWVLEFDENWSEDEEEMLTSHISIKERVWFNVLLKFLK